jgi:hypothetical protein
MSTPVALPLEEDKDLAVAVYRAMTAGEYENAYQLVCDYRVKCELGIMQLMLSGITEYKGKNNDNR